MAIGVKSVKLHPVRMFGQRLAAIEQHMLFFDERHIMPTQQQHAPIGAHGLQHAGDGRGVDRIGRLAHEPQQHALVGAVPLAGRAQRPIELGAHAGHARQQAIALQPLHEQERRPHRAHRMRTGRPYAYLEKVENGNCHAHTPYLGPPPAMAVDSIIRAGPDFRCEARRAMITELFHVIYWRRALRAAPLSLGEPCPDCCRCSISRAT
ncbi:Uncharacterised protein [Bordetella pertussis]|nr:Uncharacterised protein [Bordetella pertussis]